MAGGVLLLPPHATAGQRLQVLGALSILKTNPKPVTFFRATDVEAYTHNLNERTTLAQQRSQQLSRDIDSMRLQLTATKHQLLQLVPIKNAATVRPPLISE